MKRPLLPLTLAAILSVGSSSCVPPTTPVIVVEVRSGSGHTCAVRSDQTLACWGNNRYGQLGSLVHAGTDTANPTPALVSGLTGVTAVAAGRMHTCALRSDQTVSCWGNNVYGQLGNPLNASVNSATATPLTATGLIGVIAIDAYYDHTCALRSDGTVACWGSNISGESGHSTNLNVAAANPTPTIVAGVAGATDIALGESHTCALRADSTVSCWGFNRFGQLGRTTNSGTTNPNPTAVTVTALTGVAAISAGDEHTCAVTHAGTVTCWGMNNLGQIGSATNLGTFTANPTPTAVAGLTDVETIGGGNFHVCAAKTDGALLCWGANGFGQLGSTSPATPTPTPAVGVGAVQQVTGGAGLTCVLRPDRAVVCWGYNHSGQAGNTVSNGTDDGNPTPTIIAGL